jgi:hypothetical protein
MSEEKNVEVEIKCMHMVSFNQTVRMKQSDYEKLKDLKGDDVFRSPIQSDQEKYILIMNHLDQSVWESYEERFLNVQIERKEDHI